MWWIRRHKQDGRGVGVCVYAPPGEAGSAAKGKSWISHILTLPSSEQDISLLTQRPHQCQLYSQKYPQKFKEWLFFVHKKANLITCQITARCVTHLSHGRPFYRPLQPSSGYCIHTGHNPLLQGCTKNTQFLLFKSFSPKSSKTYIITFFDSLFHSCKGAECTYHWVWERSIEFLHGPKTVTPPTGCAQRPGSSSQPHPTGSTRLHGSHWRTACLRKRGRVHVRCRSTWSPEEAPEWELPLKSLWLLTDWPLTLMSDRIWSWWSDRQRISATDIEELGETVNL